MLCLSYDSQTNQLSHRSTPILVIDSLANASLPPALPPPEIAFEHKQAPTTSKEAEYETQRSEADSFSSPASPSSSDSSPRTPPSNKPNPFQTGLEDLVSPVADERVTDRADTRGEVSDLPVGIEWSHVHPVLVTLKNFNDDKVEYRYLEGGSYKSGLLESNHIDKDPTTFILNSRYRFELRCGNQVISILRTFRRNSEFDMGIFFQ